MILESKETQIGARRYVVTPLQFSQARKTLVRLLNVLGPAVEKAVGSASSGADSLANVQVNVGGGIGALLERLDEPLLDHLVETFAPKTQVSNDVGDLVPLKSVQELIFAGPGLMDFMQWLKFCLEVNFGGFFGELGNLVGARKAAATESQSRATSTGPNGVSLPRSV